MLRTDKFILAAILKPLAIFLGMALAALTLEESIRLANAFADQKGPASVLFDMLFNLLPEYLALGLQVSFFLGVLFGFRRLKKENALAALYASGLPLRRIARPVALASLTGGLAALFIAGVWQPIDAYKFERDGFLLAHGAFGFSVKPGEWLEIGDGATVRIAAYDKKTRRLSGIFIEERSKDGSVVVTTAREGVLLSSQDNDGVALLLREGRQARDPANDESPGVLNFDEMTYVLHTPPAPVFRRPGERAKEATLAGLWRTATGKAEANDQTRSEFVARLNVIIIQSLSFVPFALLGVALGAGASTRGRDLTAPAGLLIYVAFVQCLSAGEAQAIAGSSPPLVAMWLLLGVLSAASLYLFLQRSEQFSPSVRTLSARTRPSFLAEEAFPAPVRSN